MRLIDKPAMAIIDQQHILADAGDVQVHITVAVDVGGSAPHPKTTDPRTAFVRYIGEGSVAIVVIQSARRIRLMLPQSTALDEEDIEKPIAIIMG